MKPLIAAAALAMIAAPALAEDAAKGEKLFNKCKACHSIVSDSGETIVKGGRTGPNLFGVVGRQAGTYPDFRYGKDLIAAGEAGLVWDEEALQEYLKDPRKFLQHHLEDKKAKSNMSFKLPKGAEDIYAYLATFSAAPAEDAAGDEGADEEKASE
ncbi:c-type cytochrome [Pseudodonghicola flavimaris]|uniref:C-type cytochrome n=1 Tax=Pseudodonghicola flavimaris TaxID=3050036 RepID=A0ABT7EZK1_9RHOB|nr:c-type cytochrome [Pseudodonghicola flavimaris]MDK3017782.1 c-type cytochrome [Pseudodonghicola flavimaris]